MSDDHVKRLRDARKWFNNDGQCCGQVDSVGTCAAPACIFGEALKEFYQAADLIEAQAAEIERLRARVAELRQIIRYVAGCEHATASDEDLLEQVAAAICRMNNIDPTDHISIDGSPFNWAWKHFLPQARAALGGKDE